ncbi:ABC transporter permease [soil metagenome]
MTTTITPRVATGSGLSFGGILNSEWIKLRTLRSTIWCFGIIILLTIGFGILLAFAIGGQSTSSGTAEARQSLLVQVSTVSIGFSQLVAAVLGALVITGEYGTGMIRSTLTAVPKRIPALAAKVIVFGLLAFIVEFVSLAITAAIGASILAGNDLSTDLGDGKLWLALLGGAGYIALVGLLALSLGTIIRNSAGGIAAALGLVLVLPTVVQIFAAVTQAKWAQNISAFLPSEAGAKMYSYAGSTASAAAVNSPTSGVIVLEPWQGFLVLVAWVVVLFAIAATLLKRRDA